MAELGELVAVRPKSLPLANLGPLMTGGLERGRAVRRTTKTETVGIPGLVARSTPLNTSDVIPASIRHEGCDREPDILS